MLKSNLTGTLKVLGKSLLSLKKAPNFGASDNARAAAADGPNVAEAAATTGTPASRAAASSSGGNNEPTTAVPPAVPGNAHEEDGAIGVLKKALGMLKVESVAKTAMATATAASSVASKLRQGDRADGGGGGGDESAMEKATITAMPGVGQGGVGVESRAEDDVRRDMAEVLDALSEAYAHERLWEQARCVKITGACTFFTRFLSGPWFCRCVAHS